MKTEFIPINFAASLGGSFFTADGGKLQIVPETLHRPFDWMKNFIPNPEMVTFSFALGVEERREELVYMNDGDICHCRVRVADADGNLWEAKSVFFPDTFLENIVDWRRWQCPEPFKGMPEEWEQAFENRCLLTGIRGYYEDKVYRYLVLDEEVYDIIFKHQYPIFDVALLEAGHLHDDEPPHLLVRVSNFQPKHKDELPPFTFQIECETLMFYAVTEGLPVPLIFEKVGTTEQKQPVVRYVLGQGGLLS